jgi:hypothetical protein
MSAIIPAVALMLLTPGGGWGDRSAFSVRELHRFDTLENCKRAARIYLGYTEKSRVFCLEGVLGK